MPVRVGSETTNSFNPIKRLIIWTSEFFTSRRRDILKNFTMKKSTVISISVILFALHSLQSCRQDEMDMMPENNTLASKKYQQKIYHKTEKDSIQTTSEFSSDDSEFEIDDPPPKDKDQWKLVSP